MTNKHFLLLLLPVYLGCQSTPTVRSSKVVKTSVEQTVSSVNAGTVRAEKSAELAFGSVGRVKSVNVSLGDAVNSGVILAEVENEDLSEQLAVAKRELERKLELPPKAVSASDQDRARQAYKSAQIAYEKSLIRAPYDGLVVELNLDVGQLSQITAINPNAMIRVIDTKPRYVRAEIDEADQDLIKVGQEARVRIMAVGKGWIAAKVRKIIPFVNASREQERTVEIEVDFVDQFKTIPVGASADIEIVSDVHSDVIAVPTRAVMGRSDDRFVFLIKSNQLIKTPIKVGLFNYDYTEVIGGSLKVGDTLSLPHESLDLKDHQEVKVALQHE